MLARRYRRGLPLLSLSLSLSLIAFLAGCSNPSITGLNITPSAATIAAGGTAQFTATGIYSQGSHPKSSQNVTDLVAWKSSNTGVATISSSGVVTAVTAGTATITASVSGFPGTVSANAIVTVTSPTSGGGGTPDLTSVAIIPGSQTIDGLGETTQFIAIGTYAGNPGYTANLTDQSTWNTSTPTVGTVNQSGLATAVGQGTTTITAIATNPSGGVVTGTATFTVVNSGGGSAPDLTSVALIPGSQTVGGLGETTQFLAIGTYAGNPGYTANLTNQSTWNTSTPTVGTVNQSGLATAAGQGTTTITAMATNPAGGEVTGTATFTVASVSTALQSLTLIPSAQTVTALGQTSQFIAIGSYGGSPAATVNLTTSSDVAWSSSDTSVAAVNSSGLVTAAGAGTTTVTAIYTDPKTGNIVTGTASFTVLVPASTEPLLSLSIIPGSQAVVSVGETGQFIALGTFSSAPTTRDVTSQVTWTSSDPKVATVDASGLVTGLNAGSTAITAIYKEPDGSLVTGAASFTEDASGTGKSQLATLTVVPAGANASSGDIVSTDSAGGLQVIHCGPGLTGGSVCVGTFPVGSTVTLTASPASGSSATFYGWSSNCTVGAKPNVCTVTLTNNDTVGAIFN